MRLYVSKNLGNGFRIGTSFSGKGCGSCLTVPFILIGYIYYYLLFWPIKTIIKSVVGLINDFKSSKDIEACENECDDVYDEEPEE